MFIGLLPASIYAMIGSDPKVLVGCRYVLTEHLMLGSPLFSPGAQARRGIRKLWNRTPTCSIAGFKATVPQRHVWDLKI